MLFSLERDVKPHLTANKKFQIEARTLEMGKLFQPSQQENQKNKLIV